jgi:hypothetical protein
MTKKHWFSWRNQESSFSANTMEQKSRVKRVNEAIGELSA